jgi:hypothetical protein
MRHRSLPAVPRACLSTSRPVCRMRAGSRSRTWGSESYRSVSVPQPAQHCFCSIGAGSRSTVTSPQQTNPTRLTVHGGYLPISGRMADGPTQITWLTLLPVRSDVTQDRQRAYFCGHTDTRRVLEPRQPRPGARCQRTRSCSRLPGDRSPATACQRCPRAGIVRRSTPSCDGLKHGNARCRPEKRVWP